MSGTSMAMVLLLRVRRLRASRLGRYPRRLAASKTRARVSSLMRCATAPPASTRLTVLTDVFVSRAISIRVGGNRFLAIMILHAVVSIANVTAFDKKRLGDPLLWETSGTFA